jgi:DNA-binding NtrC family response regulator
VTCTCPRGGPISEFTHHVLHIGGTVIGSPAIRDILRASAGEQFELESVHTLAAALERLTTGGIAAVLLDWPLPDGPGLDDVMGAVLRAVATVPVFVIGADGSEGMTPAAIQAGARDYLLATRLDSYWFPRAIRDAIRAGPSDEHGMLDTDHVGTTLG